MIILWTKALHIVFVVFWYAGLLYLPRLFVYHALTEDAPGRERFRIMERKLFAIMTIGAVGALVFGVWTVALLPAYLTMGWMQIKIALVAVLVGFHAYCYRWMRALRAERDRHGHRFYRWINEIPAVVLVIVVILVVVKPA